MFSTISVTETCHAKLNLFLHITGKRPDAYHDLQSWVAFIEPADVLTLREAKKNHFYADGPFASALPPAKDNLIMKTIELMSQRHGKKKAAFYVELKKNLPVGSGMGGGSADVAGTLRALQKFWGFEWHTEDAAWLAKNLGADVPICLAGQSCMVDGIGDHLHPTSSMPANCHVVLVFPGVHVSTTSIFERISPPYTPPVKIKTQCQDVVDLAQILRETRNDLMQAAMSTERQILSAFRRLTEHPGCLLARMTGSGSTCFGIFADAETAQAATRAILKAEPRWWVRATRLLTAAEV